MCKPKHVIEFSVSFCNTTDFLNDIGRTLIFTTTAWLLHSVARSIDKDNSSSLCVEASYFSLQFALWGGDVQGQHWCKQPRLWCHAVGTVVGCVTRFVLVVLQVYNVKYHCFSYWVKQRWWPGWISLLLCSPSFEANLTSEWRCMLVFGISTPP